MPPPRSREIYAYCHVRSRQVVYSLRSVLQNNDVKKQLPDTGANSSFVSLRKDLWKPLWTLSFPHTENAVKQNLHAFKKLREWRKLHETCWEPPPLLSKPFTEKEVEEMEEKLAERGGKKKESVFDVIKHKKRKMRVKEVLNQKANSVADLAAVLIEQDQLGADTIERKEREAREDKERQVRDMLRRAQEADDGMVEQHKARIKELEEVRDKAERLGETEDMSKRQMRRELLDLRISILKMKFAARVVKEAREQAATKADEEAQAARGAGQEAVRAAGPEQSQTEAQKDKIKQLGEAAVRAETEAQTIREAMQASSLERTSPELTKSEKESTKVKAAKVAELERLLPFLPGYPIPANASIPRRGLLKNKLKRANRPVYNTEGVTIKWANQLDAELAESWPETVAHAPMGFVRHRAPVASAEPITDVVQGRQKRVDAALEVKRMLIPKPPRPEFQSIRADVLRRVQRSLTRTEGREQQKKREARKQSMKEGEAVEGGQVQ